MCGLSGICLRCINGVQQKTNIGQLLYESLKRLDYRGYDSAGNAIILNGELEVRKDVGKIDTVNPILKLNEMTGTIGIGHTRWATHGAASKENAHPHVDCDYKIAVVHNGVIDNFLELRRELEAIGHTLLSRTDTEVIPHLIEENIKNGKSLRESTRLAAKKLMGSYAATVISSYEPDKIIAIKNESPLIIGLGEKAFYCASDLEAFMPFERVNGNGYEASIIFLEDGDLAELNGDEIVVQKIPDGALVNYTPQPVYLEKESVFKGGYRHFMRKEIDEQPTALRNTLRLQRKYLDLMSKYLIEADKVFLIGAGTSHHACLVGADALRKFAKLASIPVVSSEFEDSYHHNTVTDKSVVLAISQSGETYDTLNALKSAKKRGATILGITNKVSSAFTRLTDVYIGQQSGSEIGVAATKTFTAQVSVLHQLALDTGLKKRGISEEEYKLNLDYLHRMPELVAKTIDETDPIVEKIAEKYVDRKSFTFLGRGPSVGTAYEGRLKLLELSYLPSISYPAGESKHGFISVIESGYPIVFIAPYDETRSKIIGNIMEMEARGANIITIAEKKDKEIRELSDDFIGVESDIPGILSPIIYVIPTQLLAYHLAIKKGYDPDRPRSLAKSVTVG